MRVTEARLAMYLRCPVGDIGRDLFTETMLGCTKTLLIGGASLKLLELPAIRNEFSKAWEACRVVGVLDAELLGGHRKIPGIAQRVTSFFRDYQVLTPSYRKDLVLPSGSIEVEYAVVRPWRTDNPLLCLSLHGARSPRMSPYPDPVTLARWTDLDAREPLKEIKVLNLPIFLGQSWITGSYSLPLVRRQLNAILEAMAKEQQFAQPGNHCGVCMSHRCVEMSYGEQPYGT